MPEKDRSREIRDSARRELLLKHSPDDVGFWEIRGEDSNADLGGGHYQPLLAVAHGKYGDVVDYALEFDNFFAWGRGGDINKLNVVEVTGKSATRVKELRQRKAQLQAELHAVESELHPG